MYHDSAFRDIQVVRADSSKFRRSLQIGTCSQWRYTILWFILSRF
jgi:hypothetical protein